MDKYIVYKHTSPSNKIYIGITKRGIHKRAENGNGYKRNKYFFNAIQKYGWDNFEHKILIHGLSIEQANKWEIKLISHFKSNNKKYGYNIANGGFGGSRPIGSKLTEGHKLKISLSRIGEKNPMWNKPTHNSKRVLNIEENKVFRSVNQASLYYNISHQNIHKVCNGERKTCGGYHWKFIS